MSNSVSDGGAAGPYLDNIEIREGDEEQLLDIVSLGEKVFMSSWNEQMVATSMYGTYQCPLYNSLRFLFVAHNLFVNTPVLTRLRLSGALSEDER